MRFSSQSLESQTQAEPTPVSYTHLACKAAKAHGVKISCDLNYRGKLWTRDEARAAMTELCQYVDVCISNEEDAKDVFGIEAENTDKMCIRDSVQPLDDRYLQRGQPRQGGRRAGRDAGVRHHFRGHCEMCIRDRLYPWQRAELAYFASVAEQGVCVPNLSLIHI